MGPVDMEMIGVAVLLFIVIGGPSSVTLWRRFRQLRRDMITRKITS